MAISQSASLDSLYRYFKGLYGGNDQEARRDAEEAYHNLVEMRAQGYIDGWYFDGDGHLELEPSEWVMQKLAEK